MTTNITPVSIWKAGCLLQATQVEAYLINDNLSDQATVFYRMLASSGEELASGNLILSDSNYAQTNANRISWILTQLNLTV